MDRHLNSRIDHQIVCEFVDECIKCFKPKSALHLCISNFDIFGKFNFENVKEITDLNDEDFGKKKFDLALCDAPLGMHHVGYEFNGHIIRIQFNWAKTITSLKALTENGTVLTILEPGIFFTTKGAKFKNLLNQEGFYFKAIFNAPENILQPHTSITPVIAAISRVPDEKLFVAELLDQEQARKVVRNLTTQKSGNNLATGIIMPATEFLSFKQIKIKQQIERLETQYKNYDEYRLGALTDEINLVKSGESHSEKENAVYIPKIGNSPVISSLSDAKLKHHNYFQVVLKSNIHCEYVTAFFRSALGKLVLESLTAPSFIPHLNKQELQEATLALPGTEEQELIVKTWSKLKELQEALHEFNKELALNPTSSEHILSDLDSMLASIGALTYADNVRALIRQGESKTLEYKESLSLNVKIQTKDKDIEKSSLKTIIAFLNTDGGTLIIGVSDDGEIHGVDAEIEKFYKKSSDKFLLHVHNLVNSKIGPEFYPYIDYRLVNIDSSSVLTVECLRSETPCFLDNRDFYVRTNPATDKLEGQKLYKYIDHHFEK